MNVFFVAGQSGSGKTTVMQVFSELRYTVLEGIPHKNVINFLKEMDEENVCVIVSEDLNDNFNAYIEVIEEAKKLYDVKTIYIHANDNILINRYKELRKIHPLQLQNSKLGLEEAIDLEEERQLVFQQNADFSLDTSYTSVSDLRNGVKTILSVNEDKLTINILSFGFKHGNIKDADFVFDVRFLPNPHYVKELRHKTGLDSDVFDYVFSYQEANEFYKHIHEIIILSATGYEAMKKLNITVAFACTGGQHRSVSFAERLGKDLSSKYNVNVTHLESKRGNW